MESLVSGRPTDAGVPPVGGSPVSETNLPDCIRQKASENLLAYSTLAGVPAVGGSPVSETNYAGLYPANKVTMVGCNPTGLKGKSGFFPNFIECLQNPFSNKKFPYFVDKNGSFINLSGND